MQRILTLLALSAASLFAQAPTVTGFYNNYGGNIPIAQGSILTITGTNLSTATTGLQNVPLATTLSNVRVRFTVNATSTYGYLYYVTPGQIAVIVPSSTPTGDGNIIIERNGTNSAPFNIKIVRSSFGTLTLNQAGTGTAAVYDQSYRLLGDANATNPGQYIVFWGSGVGPTTKDESVSQSGSNASGDLTTIPITVTIGGKNANVLYRGRSEFPGLDQINVQVPTLDTNTYSCSVAVTITTNGVTGNSTTIPVSASGSTCTNPSTGGGGGDNGGNNGGLTQSEIDGIISRRVMKSGTVTVSRTTSYSTSLLGGGETVTKTDTAGGGFQSISGADLRAILTSTSSLPGFQLPAAGVCNIFDSQTIPNLYPNLTYATLDAGSALTLSGPGGTKSVARSVTGGSISYSADLGTNYYAPGNYTFTGPGGPQVGSFSISVDVAPEIVWTNRASLSTVNRGSGITVTWTGGEPSQLVYISGSSYTISGSTVAGKTFQCYANQSAGSFTVPASIATQLPASTSVGGFAIPGSLAISSVGKQSRGSASGLDVLWFNSQTSVASTVTYQ